MVKEPQHCSSYIKRRGNAHTIVIPLAIKETIEEISVSFSSSVCNNDGRSFTNKT